MRAVLFALAVATVVGEPAGAAAISMLPVPLVREPAPVRPTELRLERREVEVSCPDEADEVPCELRVRLHLSNPTTEVVELTLGWRTEHAAAVLRGDLVRESGRSTPADPDASAVVVVPPGRPATVELQVTVTLWPGDPPNPFVTPGLVARHWVVGDDPSVGSSLQPVDYVDGGWSSDTVPVDVVAALPEGWELSSAPPSCCRGEETDRRGVRITIRRPTKLVFHGGPFVAVGGSFERGLRVRAGYEIGFVEPLIASASVETGFDDLVLAAQLEAALPQIMLVFPSLALGLGVPVRVVPDVEVGMRIELSAVAFLGFVSTFDYYPGADRWEIALLGRASL